MTDPRLVELQEALEGLDVSLTTLRVAIRRFRSRPPNSTLALTRTHRGRGIAIIPDIVYIPTVPGATTAQTVILMLMHVVVAVVILLMLTMLNGEETE